MPRKNQRFPRTDIASAMQICITAESVKQIAFLFLRKSIYHLPSE